MEYKYESAKHFRTGFVPLRLFEPECRLGDTGTIPEKGRTCRNYVKNNCIYRNMGK